MNAPHRNFTRVSGQVLTIRAKGVWFLERREVTFTRPVDQIVIIWPSFHILARPIWALVFEEGGNVRRLWAMSNKVFFFFLLSGQPRWGLWPTEQSRKKRTPSVVCKKSVLIVMDGVSFHLRALYYTEKYMQTGVCTLKLKLHFV